MAHVLIVDDEKGVRDLLRRVLEADGHTTATAPDVATARDELRRDRFELVLCDVNMPGESGIDLVRDALSEHLDLAVLMVSGMDDPQLAETALELGAYGYVVKPFRTSELTIAVANSLRRRRLEIENRAHRERLEQMVLERTRALRGAVADLERKERELQLSREETIHRLARAAEFRNEETGRHIERVSRYCFLLAERLGLEPDRCELLRLASPLHDIGKIAIPDRILLKPGALTADEERQMHAHAELGYRMLADSGQPLLELAALVARTHHERFDGRGYPRQLAGESIPLEGRITAVADVFDALTTDRVYRRALAVDETVPLLRAGSGTQFDPVVLEAFLESLPLVLAIRREHSDDGPAAAAAGLS